MMRISVGPVLARIAFAATTIALSGCALDPQGGYQPMTQSAGSSEPPVTFNEANSQCWIVSMSIAGFAATMPELDAYKACMARNGWQDRRRLF
jgi:hypothetical protein